MSARRDPTYLAAISLHAGYENTLRPTRGFAAATSASALPADSFVRCHDCPAV
jgi:hypothetical protein